jgi:hypothetical protein
MAQLGRETGNNLTEKTFDRLTYGFWRSGNTSVVEDGARSNEKQREDSMTGVRDLYIFSSSKVYQFQGSRTKLRRRKII